MNVDGALFPNGCMSIGVVLRDNKGCILISQAIHSTAIGDIQSIEALAILTGLELAKSYNLRILCIESDAQTLVKAINSQETCFFLCCNLDNDIRLLMSTFEACNLNFIRRDENHLAHSIANSKSNWLGGLSSSLFDVATLDIT
ncbi:uncharacterized protein [Rutidosis leptorrhynchoides]|uniref:uncharacterized protein n=1 Tax=Rutidosis leptorrhynchoides TaxID=125765 RepID=UPI003A9A1254